MANPILGQDPDEKLKKQYPNLFWKPPQYKAGVTGADTKLAWQREFDLRKWAMLNDRAAQRRYQQQLRSPVATAFGAIPEDVRKRDVRRVTLRMWQEHVDEELKSKGWSRDQVPKDFDASKYTVINGQAYTAEEMKKAGYQLSDGYWTVPDPYAGERKKTVEALKRGENKSLRATILRSRPGFQSTKKTGPRGVEAKAPVQVRTLLGGPPGDVEIKKKKQA